MKRKLGQIKVRPHINFDRCPFTTSRLTITQAAKKRGPCLMIHSNPGLRK